MTYQQAVGVLRDVSGGVEDFGGEKHMEACRVIRSEGREHHDTRTSIYFIVAVTRDRKWDAIKIGIARDPARRCAQLQTSSHQDLVLFSVYTGFPFEERQIHERFASDRIRGEWFRASDELIRYIAKLSNMQLTAELDGTAILEMAA
jgi:hypothetical protein